MFFLRHCWPLTVNDFRGDRQFFDIRHRTHTCSEGGSILRVPVDTKTTRAEAMRARRKARKLMKLAAQVAAEQDPKKFHALIVELNELLQEKEHRLQTQSNPAARPTRE
jgi:hypothetical protein